MVLKKSKRVAKARKELTTQEIFCNPEMERRLSAIAGAHLRDKGFNPQVKCCWDTKDESFVADMMPPSTLRLNFGHPSLNDLTPQQIYRKSCGETGHEVAHFLWTNFVLHEEVMKSMSEGKWEKCPPYELDVEWYEEAVNDLRKRLAANSKYVVLYHALFNILEDAYINRRLMKRFPYGIFSYGLKFSNYMNTRTYEQFTPEDVEENSPSVSINVVLRYAKFGYPWADNIEDSVPVKYLRSCIPYIEKSLTAPPAIRERCAATMLVLLWPQLNSEEDVSKATEAGGAPAYGEPSPGMTGYDKSLEGEGDGDPESGGGCEGEDGEESRDAAAAKTREKLGMSGEGKAADDELDKAIREEAAKAAAAAGKTGMSKSGGSDDVAGDSVSSSGSAKKSERELETDTDTAVEAAKEAAAEKKASEEVRKELEKDAAETEGVKPSVTKVVHRDSFVSSTSVADYNRANKLELAIAYRTAKRYEQIEAEGAMGGLKTGLYNGDRLCVSQAYRRDSKMFQKRIAPTETPKPAFLVLVDESGSMGGKKEEAARKTAIVMQAFCSRLNIPCAIIGHAATDGSGPRVDLYEYVDFEDTDGKDKYRLMSIRARDNNRDGDAIRIVTKKFMRRDEEKKILMIISDGLPEARGYCGASANKDTAQAVIEAEKKGIKVIAAGIGSCREDIEELYRGTGARYLDITKLEELPKTFIGIVKEFIEN